MKYLPYAALLAALASAASTPEAPNPGPIRMDFTVLRGSSLSSASEGGMPALVKRDGQQELTLTNRQTYYAATLKIGTQGAENSVIIDTGSSDLWIMSNNVACATTRVSKRTIDDFPAFSHRRLMDFELSELEDLESESVAENEKRADTTITLQSTVRASQVSAVAASQVGTGGTATTGGTGAAACTASGSFNTAASNSFKANSSAPNFSITYADRTYARGFWGTDFVDFGTANASDCSFAVVTSTSSNIGVFGIGLAGLQVTYSGSSSGSSYTYENFPLRLKSMGAINKVLYSLYLNSADASSGSVLFGAVDHAKYSGQLQTVPIVNIYRTYYRNPIRFDIVLDSITLESSSQNVTVSSSHIPALLDSGTTLTYLPTAMLNSLVNSLGASLDSSGYYRLSCNYDTNKAFAVFNFSGVIIKVPMSDMILNSGSRCYLGVLGSSSDSLTGTPYAILGDNFLRSAYVVYNLEDYEISLAQVNYSDSENIETVSSSVPSAVRAAGYSSTGLASSVSSDSSSSQLSSSGLKKSEGATAFYFAKSLLFGAIGAGLIFVF